VDTSTSGPGGQPTPAQTPAPPQAPAPSPALPTAQPSAASDAPIALEAPTSPLASAQTQLVFFDLDETLTRHDTLLPYAWGFMLRYTPWRIPLMLGVLPAVLQFALRLGDESVVKQSFIRCALGGSRRTTIEAWTARFVPRLIAKGLLPDALKQLAEHRRRGDHLVLMSASTDLYVPAIARELGFTETVCTGVRWDGEKLDGSLTTPNRKGAEKARCFTALAERHSDRGTVAYGNSFTDLPHLRLAKRGVLVNGSHKARRAAQSFGVVCVDWH
jgi:HAD superfamily hydrolase (TIGR01490 family)